jgi:hypothetical protein
MIAASRDLVRGDLGDDTGAARPKMSRLAPVQYRDQSRFKATSDQRIVY